MFQYVYEWLRNLSYYLILVTAVLHVIPSEGYKKYIRFFTGLVLILMLLNPILELMHMDFDIEDKISEVEEIVIGEQ